MQIRFSLILSSGKVNEKIKFKSNLNSKSKLKSSAIPKTPRKSPKKKTLDKFNITSTNNSTEIKIPKKLKTESENKFPRRKTLLKITPDKIQNDTTKIPIIHNVFVDHSYAKFSNTKPNSPKITFHIYSNCL